MPYKDKDERLSKSRAYSKAYYQKNKERLRKKQQCYLSVRENYAKHAAALERKRKRNLEEIRKVKLAYGCCSPNCCWEGDFVGCDLDLHHLDSSEKNNSVSKMTTLSMKNLCSEINKCVVLCAVCHRRFHEKHFALSEQSLCKVTISGTSLIIG